MVLGFILFLVGIVCGVLIDDAPYFTLDRQLRPFEIFTFIFITLFGFWFQRYTVKNTRKYDSVKEVMKDVSNDCLECLNDIHELVECGLSKNLDDNQKKMIHQKLKDLSFHIEFLSELNSSDSLKEQYFEYKNDIVNEDFSTSSFTVDQRYYRDVSNSTNLIRKIIRQFVYSQLTASR